MLLKNRVTEAKEIIQDILASPISIPFKKFHIDNLMKQIANQVQNCCSKKEFTQAQDLCDTILDRYPEKEKALSYLNRELLKNRQELSALVEQAKDLIASEKFENAQVIIDTIPEGLEIDKDLAALASALAINKQFVQAKKLIDRIQGADTQNRALTELALDIYVAECPLFKENPDFNKLLTEEGKVLTLAYLKDWKLKNGL